MLYILVIVLAVAADQAVKFYVVSHLALYESAPLIPGFVELYYIQNTGGGFSILTDHTWLLAVLTAVLMAVIAVLLVKRTFSHPMAMWALTRVRLGYVVDMFNFQFIRFPVFYVADMLVVGGTILFAAYYLLLHDKVTKKEAADHDGTGEADGGQ